ncbi:unnamed protein product [Symbiodinium sp. CCMP2592]|nr:unnamed protein product [Symbiodinium sp. CCMP2592]
MVYLTLAQGGRGELVAPASLSMHRYDMSWLQRETHIIAYASGFLPENLKTLYIQETENLRSVFYAEDRVFNVAMATWDAALPRFQVQDL